MRRAADMMGHWTPKIRRFPYLDQPRGLARARRNDVAEEAIPKAARYRCNLQPPIAISPIVLLSGSVIVLAYVAAAAVIIPAVSMIGFGKVPKFLRRGDDPGKARTRMEGAGLLLIGAFILADALAADLGRRSSVPQDWILLVWVLRAAGLIGLRYLAGRTENESQKPTA